MSLQAASGRNWSWGFTVHFAQEFLRCHQTRRLAPDFTGAGISGLRVMPMRAIQGVPGTFFFLYWAGHNWQPALRGPGGNTRKLGFSHSQPGDYSARMLAEVDPEARVIVFDSAFDMAETIARKFNQITKEVTQ